jgi:solute carrier family 35 protein F5
MSAQEPVVPVEVAVDFSLSHERPSTNHDRRSMSSSRSILKVRGFKASVGLENVARRTLGIFLLLVTVFLWTASNFLASVCWSALSSEQ